ncbi:MAG: hypothetical protein ACI8ZN_001563 [Bacteroidia bacterium]
MKLVKDLCQVLSFIVLNQWWPKRFQFLRKILKRGITGCQKALFRIEPLVLLYVPADPVIFQRAYLTTTVNQFPQKGLVLI